MSYHTAGCEKGHQATLSCFPLAQARVFDHDGGPTGDGQRDVDHVLAQQPRRLKKLELSQAPQALDDRLLEECNFAPQRVSRFWRQR